MVAAIIPAFASSASAQRRYYSNSRNNRVYERPNVYQRHRKAFNIGIGSGVGALIGGLVGGKKGLIIGGLAGAGGGAVVTAVQRPQNYYRLRRNNNRRNNVRRTYNRRVYRNY